MHAVFLVQPQRSVISSRPTYDMKHIKYLVLLGMFLCGVPLVNAYADAAGTPGSIAETEQRQAIQLILDNLATDPEIDAVLQNRQQIKNDIAGYNQKITQIQKEIGQLDQALAGIGDKNGEKSVVNQALSELVALKQQKELELVELRLLMMTAEEALKQLNHYIERQKTRETFFQEKPLWRILAEAQAAHYAPDRQTYTAAPKSQQTVLFLIVVTSLIFGLSCMPKVLNLIKAYSSPCNMVHIFMLLITQARVISKFFLGFVIFSTLFISLTFFMFSGHPPIVMGSLILYFYLVLRLLLQALIYRFRSASATSSNQPLSGAQGNVNLYAFSLISAVVIVFSSDYNIYQTSTGIAGALSSLLYFAWLLSLFMFSRYFCSSVQPAFWRYVKLPLLIAVLFLAGLECFGFRNLTDYVIVTTGYTFSIFALALIFYDSIDLLMESFRASKDMVVNRFSLTPVEEKRRVKTHKILGIGLKLYVVVSAIILVLHQWNITDTDNEKLFKFFLEGADFSGFIISPARITLALLLFVLSWPAIEYFKQFIDRSWLASADMTKSARDTFLTVSGYVGYAVVILLTLGVAGIKLTGLTVIIGALSVGIGFGLQNVVNNFISGLILMFERPIKKGDWIVVGTTEGYVKKISIRSTIVQTFDRSDVIVPNSELIANQVTNMMFDDQRGRLRVSVGVAYGSNTELVKRLLLEVAHSHNQVIMDGSTPEPRVYFQAFGDSSLNFDLLVHLKDVDLRIVVRSEMHMAIDKIFREHDIVIPFPQRDVHMKHNGVA